MKVAVDMKVCQNHGQCAFSAPDVFQLDAEGQLLYVAEPADSLREDVEDAADVCPLQAITIED
ncbi:ferredoxin [Streptomyces sp. NPDC051561]|uniref:ferredoxin n=1 Tax=Streptomyces sp. NPDC051561 TaxID=3365658 RepID=UPI003793BF51